MGGLVALMLCLLSVAAFAWRRKRCPRPMPSFVPPKLTADPVDVQVEVSATPSADEELKKSMTASLERLTLPAAPGKRSRELMSGAAARESERGAVDLTDDACLKQLEADVAASEARLEAARRKAREKKLQP